MTQIHSIPQCHTRGRGGYISHFTGGDGIASWSGSDLMVAENFGLVPSPLYTEGDSSFQHMCLISMGWLTPMLDFAAISFCWGGCLSDRLLSGLAVKRRQMSSAFSRTKAWAFGQRPLSKKKCCLAELKLILLAQQHVC